jgi:hypothetical protein
MNIQTVAENLEKTIAGKEQLLAEYRTMTLVLRQDESPEIYATVKFLEINIDELKRILEDVEQCIPKEPEFDESDSEEVRNLIRMGR